MRYDVRDMDNTLAQETSGGNRITAVGVLDRSVALLDLLAAGPRSLRVLAETSGLPRPTAHRLLVALEAHRLVGREPDGRFRLGPRLTELAVRAGRGLDLAGLAGPVLARLHEQTGESAQLYLRSGDRRLCAAACDAGSGLYYSVPVGACCRWTPGPAERCCWPSGRTATGSRRCPPPSWPRSRGAAGRRATRNGRTGWPVSARRSWPARSCSARCACPGPASRLTQAACRQLAPVVIAAAGDLAVLAG